MYVHKMHTVQSYCAQLTGTDRIITNIGINFQYKVHIQFQELTKYQWKKKHNLESTKSMKCYCNSQHNTAPVHCSCGAQQSTQYSTSTLQLWRTTANTIQHQYISVVAHNSQHNTAPVHFSCGAQQQPTSLKFYTLNYLCSCKLMYWKNKTLWNLSYIVMQKEICCIISLFPQNAIYFTTLSPSVQVIRPS